MLRNIGTRISNVFRYLNKTRRNKSRFNRLKKEDIKVKNQLPIPDRCKHVLIISTSDGFGDSLYTTGFAYRLKNLGATFVAIAAPNHILNHYTNPIFDNVYSLEKDTFKITKFPPDLIIDLTFANINYYSERSTIIKSLKCPAVTVSEISKNLNIYSHFIDFKQRAHISERLALILDLICHHKSESPVMPRAYASNNDLAYAQKTISSLFPDNSEGRIAYLNTIARHADRCLTQTQADALIQTLFMNGYDKIIIHSRSSCAPSNNKIQQLPELSFQQLAALISEMNLVVTPDTSVTHLAACYNIPTMVIFPPNDRDLWPQYAAKDVWGALSTRHVIYSRDDPDMRFDIWGYPTSRPRSCAVYSACELQTCLNNFLNS